MFKVFHPNSDYEFDLKGYFRLNGKITPHSGDDMINILIQNETYQLSRVWLGLIAHYEVADLKVRDLLKIVFEDCSSKVIGLKCGSLMVHVSPIYLEGSFALVPGFPRFLINQNGDVKSRITGRILKKAIGPYGYPYVNVYDPDKERWRSVSVHILVARTFVPNRFPNLRWYVNHKNGNKLDYRVSNLEWSTSSENNTHAVNTALRNDNEPCRVRNVLTGEITEHASIGAGLRSAGLRSKSKKLFRFNGKKNIPILFMGKYEIKTVGDKSPWFHKVISINPADQLRGPYQFLNTATGQEGEGEYISSLVKLTGVTLDRITNVLRSKEPRVVENYYFRTKSNDPWPKDFIHVKFHEPRKIEVENLNDGKILRFGSIRQATKVIGLDKRTLKQKLKNGGIYRNWYFREV